MPLLRIGRCALFFVIAAGLFTGCGPKSIKPPSPLSEAEIPGALEKAFAKGVPELKDSANQIVAAVQAKDYSKAFNTLQSLSGREGLSNEQIEIINRALLTVRGLLQTAEAQGDQKAAQTIQLYHTKK